MINNICTIATLFGLASLFYYHFFREIYPNGDVYEGVWDMGKYHWKGEFENEDGTKEIGKWIGGNKDGEFECYDKTERLTHRKVYKDDKEIECAEVKQQI